MPAQSADRVEDQPTNPLRGVVIGTVLVLVAVLVGVILQRAAEPGTQVTSEAADAPATGNTTTVEVVAEDMRFRPDHVEVPAGDRLVIDLTNADERRHDLVLGNGVGSAMIEPGGTARLDAGVIAVSLDGWCSVPGHRQAGMTFTVTVIGDQPSTDAPQVDAMAEPEPGFTGRDATLPPAEDATVHRITLRVQEVVDEVAPGIRQQLWTFNGTAPGPVLRGRVGDVFEVTLINDGSLDHGIDFHAGALAPDGPMRPIQPGERLVYRFTATRAGIWMYHCSTEPMLHHIGNGMFGAVVIDPPDLAAADREYVLVQSEMYLGADGEPGDLARMQAETPDAVVFNGYVSQYAHRPLGHRGLCRAGSRASAASRDTRQRHASTRRHRPRADADAYGKCL